jgi:hypothetical protein
MLNLEEGKGNGKSWVRHAIINIILFDLNCYEKTLNLYLYRGGARAIRKQQRRFWLEVFGWQ